MHVADTLSSDPLHFRLCFSVYETGFSATDFLLSRLATKHQEQLPQFFEEQLVSVDGEIVGPQQPLSIGQKLEVSLPDHYEEPVDTDWQKLWENDELLAVFKPHLLPVSRTTRNLYNTLISLVRRESPYSEAHLLHRLDTETGGIILLAKNSQADKKWKPKLDQLIIQKIYHAWVEGSPEWDHKVLECELSEKTGSPIRSQVYVVDPDSPELYPKPKLSKTAFRVIKRELGRSLIECELHTGRKHQIRVHLSSLGYPIIGDKIYSHEGRFYLKRLETELTEKDFTDLGSRYHQLKAVKIEINADDKSIISVECCDD
jgi:23S rRNA pseudouridine1911/1915/1917 synthase